MVWRNTSAGWGRVSRWLHWASVVLLVALAGIGLYMTGMANGLDKVKIYALHKSLGVTVLALSVLRLGWRWASARVPAESGPEWARWAARIGHVGLYLLLFLVPLSGWAFNSAAGFALRWFGLFNLPHLMPADAQWKPWLRDIHEFLFWILALLVLVHAAAGLWHHFIRRDRVLARMISGERARSDPSEIQ